MNRIWLWFNQTGSPPRFHAFAGRWMPWMWAAAVALTLYGGYLALFVAPPDRLQGESTRILYIHVPAAWMSLLVWAVMAVQAAIALVWRIKLCEVLAMACAPIGAGFTLITLVTGAVWGIPTWGTWWTWDPRLTSQLLLLFMYLGVMALYASIEDRRTGARAAGFLAIVGVVLLPVIRYSVDWWNSLHQGATVRVFGESSIDPSMVPPLAWMVVATKFWFVGALLQRARNEMLEREAGKDWARAAVAGAGTPPGLGAPLAALALLLPLAVVFVDAVAPLGLFTAPDRGVDAIRFVVAAYACYLFIFLWDMLVPWLRHRLLARTIHSRARREAARAAAPGAPA